jgi:hypothetical protein
MIEAGLDDAAWGGRHGFTPQDFSSQGRTRLQRVLPMENFQRGTTTKSEDNAPGSIANWLFPMTTPFTNAMRRSRLK